MSNKRISAVIANRLRYLIASRLEYDMCLLFGSLMLEPNWRRELISLHLSVERYRESI